MHTSVIFIVWILLVLALDAPLAANAGVSAEGIGPGVQGAKAVPDGRIAARRVELDRRACGACLNASGIDAAGITGLGASISHEAGILLALPDGRPILTVCLETPISLGIDAAIGDGSYRCWLRGNDLLGIIVFFVAAEGPGASGTGERAEVVSSIEDWARTCPDGRCVTRAANLGCPAATRRDALRSSDERCGSRKRCRGGEYLDDGDKGRFHDCFCLVIWNRKQKLL